MPRVNVYIRNEDWEAWQNIVDKPKWIHEGLQTGLVTIPPKSTPKNGLVGTVKTMYIDTERDQYVPTGPTSRMVYGVNTVDVKDYNLCKHNAVLGMCKKGCK